MILLRIEHLLLRTNGHVERMVSLSYSEKLLKKTKNRIEADSKAQFADKDDVNVDDILEDRDFLIVSSY